jgi:hypothetical protein
VHYLLFWENKISSMEIGNQLRQTLIQSPTSLDAVVYGYLACFKYPDFKDDSLKQLLRGFPNLDSFCDRITENYFNTDYSPKFALVPDM